MAVNNLRILTTTEPKIFGRNSRERYTQVIIVDNSYYLNPLLKVLIAKEFLLFDKYRIVSGFDYKTIAKRGISYNTF